MRISDWSSDVCSSDLLMFGQRIGEDVSAGTVRHEIERLGRLRVQHGGNGFAAGVGNRPLRQAGPGIGVIAIVGLQFRLRSEEHTSELQSLMRISYAVFCLKKKTN